MDETLRPTDPGKVALADGKPRALRFTNGSIRRLKAKHGVQSFQELFGREFTDIAGDFIFEGLVDKDGLTAEAVDDLIPVHELLEIQYAILAAMNNETVESGKKKAGLRDEPQATETVN